MIAPFRRYGSILHVAMVMASGAQAQQGPIDRDACHGAGAAAGRLHCYEVGARDRAQAGTSTNLPGGWRLVHAADPTGREAVAITRTAEMTRSDPDFVGLMLRCDKDGTSILVILLRPMGARATPRVRLSSKVDETRQVEATVAPPGTAVRLPSDVEVHAKGAWLSATELNIAVDIEGGTISGVVPLEGLRSAWDALTASCPQR